MTTSGTYALSLTRDDIIKSALRLCGVATVGLTPTADEITDSNQALNMMIKSWQASGQGLWLNDYIVVPLQGGWPKYTIGPSGHPASRYIMRQTIGVAAESGDFDITLENATAVDDTDIIGIALDDNWVGWTTVNGDPVGNVVTLTDALSGDAAVGNTVYFFNASESVPRPFAINSVMLWTSDGSTDTMMGTISIPGGTNFVLKPISRDEYYSLPDFMSAGQPTQYYVDPQMTNMDLYVWPLSTDMSSSLIIDAKIPVQTFDDIDDTADFPEEWLRALKFSLAVEIAPEFGVNIQKIGLLQAMADKAVTAAFNFDREDASTFFQPGY